MARLPPPKTGIAAGSHQGDSPSTDKHANREAASKKGLPCNANHFRIRRSHLLLIFYLLYRHS
jgi:hypothetical protein